MNIKEAIKVVTFLHTAYTQDRKATTEELAQRAQTYSIAFADYDLALVMRAAQHCVRTSKYYPTPSELLEAVKFIRLVPEQDPQPARVTPIDEKVVDEYLEAFCEWIGFGCEANDERELPDLKKGVLPYEN